MLTLLADVQAYRSACHAYRELCRKDEAGEPRTPEVLELRKQLLQRKRTAQEDLAMSILAEREYDLKRLGLFELYSAIAAGIVVDSKVVTTLLECMCTQVERQQAGKS